MPLKFTSRLPRPDLRASLELIDQSMKQDVLDVAKRWVIRAADSTPVLTGASKATFLKLAFQAKALLRITPRKAGRIPLGLANSTGNIFFIKGKTYGFEWSSDLEYIHVVNRHSQMLREAEIVFIIRAPHLPQPVITYSGRI